MTATVGGMLPPKPGDLLLIPSPVYGQIFVRHNGRRIWGRLAREMLSYFIVGMVHVGAHKTMNSFPYLLVKQGEVGNYEGKVMMEKGDTLELFTG